ncbi:MAG: glycosyltransferase family 2 protein [Methanobrevibacter sp.]|uniref:Glycosyltransferase family 2 protein n=1 Tax=Methanobrevibacter millerae TaxID=230361 RepID=A0A8T3VHH7_9EURY|nr:glycosyltransferase family 2 protein [Methanobrevibacter millerae]MBE6504783.1 glycosyltransferase family 2 protein [Methanobrevibacter millerae]MBR0057842.1 glycosyltransferase family 2 protein [Methanobrevibacter sp.]
MKLDIVVPCYNEEKNIEKFFTEISYVLKDIDINIIFVNDGSSDNTLNEIKKLQNVSYISFSRNFGKEAAIYAGLSKTTADYVILMDVDLQDPPSLIPEMIEHIDDFDIVATRRVTRAGEPKIRSFFARLFYKLMNKISDIELVDGARDFRLMNRSVVDSILELNENNRFSKGIFEWIGFNTKWIEYENIERIEGETSWSFWQLFKYSIEGIVSFTVAPLYISTVMGIIFSIISFFSIIFIVIRTLLFGDPVSGWPSTISIILLIGGIQLLSIGILGQYLAKTYIETKNRPKYIIKEDNF